jgi:mitogen-activated protein kinase 1/3
MSHVYQDFKMLLECTPKIEISEDHIVVMMYNALCALKYLHKANIIHRDIKPANMLIDSNCSVLLCDFGLSRALPLRDK